MAMPMYKIRIIGNACITRYDAGEAPMSAVIGSYNLSAEDRELVEAHIVSRRPDIEI
jgi:hypothetical protein